MTITADPAASDRPTSARRPGPEGILAAAGWAAVAALVLGAFALALPVDHDEGQYGAPAILAGRLRPFVDFIYLQTPLQLYLTAPLARVTPGWTFLALRLANAVLGVGVLALVYAVQLRLGVPRRRALIAAGLLLASYPFQFSAAIGRNDPLPALLESAAMLAAVAALEPRRTSWPLWALAGVLLGGATSAKLSYVLPLGAAGLFVLWGALRRRIGPASLIGFGAGALAGLAPIALAWLAAPEAFVWGVFTFAETAPRYWYRLVGQGRRLLLPVRIGEGAFHLAVGPALVVLGGVGLAALVRERRADPIATGVRLLQVLALAGLAATFLPSPMQRQYFLPMLPPLFALWGVLDPLAALGPAARKWLLVLLAAGAAVGVGRAGYVLGDAALGLLHGRAPPALALTYEAHWIGRMLRAAHREGAVATPSPQAVMDSGAPIDPRFASGAFAYRSGDLLTAEEQLRLHVTGPAALASALDQAPPAAIVTGYEPTTGRLRRNLDDDFRAYARARGYREAVSPDGVAQLWIRPR